MDFEWDENKRRQNLADHKVDFRDVISVFFDPYALDEEDTGTYDEIRYRTIGMSREGRAFFVVYTWRGNAIRIISARKAEPYERRKYHESQS